MCISLIAGYMISREQTDDTLKNILTVLTRNPNVANGVFCDNRMGTEIAQILSVSIFWFITIFIVMLMATKLKTLVCVAAYMIFYIIMNLLSFLNGIKYFSPLYYLVEISSGSSSTLLDVKKLHLLVQLMCCRKASNW